MEVDKEKPYQSIIQKIVEDITTLDQYEESLREEQYCIKLLPNELLVRILKYLDRNHLQHLRMVCESWNSLIQEAFGIKLCIQNESYKEAYSQSGKNIKEVVFLSLAQPLFDNPPFEGLSFLQSLQTLEFRNIVVSYNLLPALFSVPNLTSLKFTNIILLDQNGISQLSPKRISLHKLRSFSIETTTLGDSENAILFMLNERGDFGVLQEFHLICSNMTPILPIHQLFQEERSPLHPVVRFLWNQRHTLRIFDVSVKGSILLLKFHPFGSQKSATHPLQLKQAIINQPIKPAWIPFLVNQKFIQDLEMNECTIQSLELIRSFIGTANSLKSLAIKGDVFNFIWNCDIFQECKYLEVLYIGLRYAPKIGLCHLPHTLKVLKIAGPVTRAEMKQIPIILSNLESLELQHLIELALTNSQNESISQLVTLDLFVAFLKLPKLIHLALTDVYGAQFDLKTLIEWCACYKEETGIICKEITYKFFGHDLLNGIELSIPRGLDRKGLVPEFKNHSSIVELLYSGIPCCFSE